MPKAVGVVKKGRVALPEDVTLPEGAPVIVEWREGCVRPGAPLEREPLTREDIEADLEWATGNRFQQLAPDEPVTLTPEEDAGLRRAMDDLDAGRGRPQEEVLARVRASSAR